MPRPVCHHSDLLPVGRAVGRGAQTVEDRADFFDDLNICPLVFSTYDIGFPRNSFLEHGAEGAAVIIHKQPVTDVGSVTVYRKGVS